MNEVKRLLTETSVCVNKVQKGPTWVREMSARDLFPRPVMIGAGKIKRRMYVESEIDAWIAAQIADRDQQQAAA